MAVATSDFASPAGDCAGADGAGFGCGSPCGTCFGGVLFALGAFGASAFVSGAFVSGAFVSGTFTAGARAAIFCALKRSFTIASFTCALVLLLSSCNAR